jgi:serine/threonine protein kinase
MDLPVAEGQIVAKKYRVERLLGSGGMGVVAAAINLDLDQPVAIKFLSPDASTQGEAAERFRREARAAAKIRSEHVVRVLDVGIFEQRLPYMVMELLDGKDLGQELEARGQLPLAEAVRYVVQAIDAIAEAHGMGIVHRDLKPSNLFLARRADGSCSIKVLDFGISKLLGGEPRDIALTRTASLVGSPLYMSPEQMRSAKDVDQRTDVWALGAILYELISGSTPFGGASLPEVCVAVLNDTPRPLSAHVPEVPAEFDDILVKCLAKDREQRFSTVAALSAALVRFSPADRSYAERAERVLLHPATPSIEPPLPPGSALASTPPIREEEASLAPNSTTSPQKLAPTHSAWGNTKGGSTIRWRVPVVVVSLLAVLALVGFMARSRDASERGGLPSASAELDQGQTKTRALAAVPAPASAEMPLPSAAVSAVAPPRAADVVPTVAPVQAVMPNAAQNPAPHGLEGVARSAPLVPAAKPVFHPGAAKSTASSQVSDFGGRR